MQPGPPCLEPQGMARGGPQCALSLCPWASEKEVSIARSPHVSRVGAGLLTNEELSTQDGPAGRGVDRCCWLT